MNTRKVLFKRNSLIFQDVVDAYKIHVHKNTIHTLKTLFKSHLHPEKCFIELTKISIDPYLKEKIC